MKPFTVQLQDIAQYRRIDDAVALAGADESGAFGVLARHGRMLTALAWGLARYRTADSRWHYLMLPGGLLYCVDGEVHVVTRRFHEDDNLERLVGQFEEQLRAEEESLRAVKEHIQKLEQEMLLRFWRLEMDQP